MSAASSLEAQESSENEVKEVVFHEQPIVANNMEKYVPDGR